MTDEWSHLIKTLLKILFHEMLLVTKKCCISEHNSIYTCTFLFPAHGWLSLFNISFNLIAIHLHLDLEKREALLGVWCIGCWSPAIPYCTKQGKQLTLYCLISKKWVEGGKRKEAAGVYNLCGGLVSYKQVLISSSP